MPSIGFKFHAWRNLRFAAMRVARYFTNNRANTRDTDDKHQPISENSKDEIGYRAGSDNSGALAHCFVVERLVSQLRRQRFYTLIKHFDVTAKGISAMTYSVPCLSVRRHSALPKPIEKRSTLTPQRRATQKWPNSCTVINTPSATINAAKTPENAQHRIFRYIVPKTSNNRQANTGTAAVRLSIRSRMPPCPGIKLPLSLMPASRLNMLSVKSPNTEASAATSEQTNKVTGEIVSGAQRPNSQESVQTSAGHQRTLPRFSPVRL